MNEKLKTIIKNFQFEGSLTNIEENKQGNINKTYILTFQNNQQERKYLLQRINNNVFKNPIQVMKNIELVTNHIKKKLRDNQDKFHKTLEIIKTTDNKNLYIYDENNNKEYYRAFDFIENCISYDSLLNSHNPINLAYETGKGFGYFHKLLSDIEITSLDETIKDFHNTKKRFQDFISSIQEKLTNRANLFSKEIVFLIESSLECTKIIDELGTSIPLRVTHNDTKLNNILIDKHSGKSVAIIDLDTVMPGSFLFDVGDGIRSACSNAFEDELDEKKIFLNLDLTKAYLQGYLEEMVLELTDSEIEYLGLSIKILTYETAIRFLTDYLNGDTYFHIKYENHNADRFKNQYILFQNINLKLDEINEFIQKTIKDLKHL